LLLELFTNLIAHAAEGGVDFLLTSGGFGGILKGPVVFLGLAGEEGAFLIGIAAHGDDGVHVLLQKIIQVLGGVPVDINADLGHDLNGHGVHVTGGVGAGTGYDGAIPYCGAQDALGKVAAATIAGAKDEDEWLMVDG